MEGVTGMDSLLSKMGTIITQILTWVTNVTSTIVEDDLLFFTIGVFALGAVIGIVRRLLARG